MSEKVSFTKKAAIMPCLLNYTRYILPPLKFSICVNGDDVPDGPYSRPCLTGLTVRCRFCSVALETRGTERWSSCVERQPENNNKTQPENKSAN